MEALFSTEEFAKTEAPESLYPKCSSCLLYKKCQNGKMPHSGKGKKRILIVGEAPGEQEDKNNTQFCGETGRLLERVLDSVGIDMRRDCHLANAIACRPTRNGRNRTPTLKEVSWCRPNLVNTIKEVEPEIIIPLGAVALKSILTGLWRDKIGAVTRWLGWQIPSQIGNYWICPSWHPSYVYRDREMPDYKLLLKLWKKDLKAAVELEGRPWKKIPDYRSKVQVIMDAREAADIIDQLVKDKPECCAFDYETTCRKPESEYAEIVSCSVSDGKTTISFPWMGKAISAMKRFLKSPIPKIASNFKFEERWSRKLLELSVVNWDWCTMTGAHWLDSRSGITSIKFQAFVLLGFPIYDEGVKPYLMSEDKGGNSPNRIRECDLHALLLYGGLDSLLEWLVARVQKRRYNASVC